MELLIPALGFVTAMLLVWGVNLAMSRSGALAGKLQPYVAGGQRQTTTPAPLERSRERLSSIWGVERVLNKRGYAERVARDLARAGVPLRVGEYVFIRWLVALVLGYVVLTVSGFLPLALVVAAVGYFLPRLYVDMQRRQRRRLLEQQLVEALTVMAGTLRAGHSFLQALESVRRDSAPPIGEEFRLLLEDIAVGARVEDALVRLADRADSEELDMSVTAMLIQRSTGGNLADVLDTLAETIRERLRIRREVQTLTAQERYSSYIVGAMPLAMFALLSALNPEYLFALFGTGLGQLMLIAAAVLELIGFVVIRMIMDIDV